MLRPYTTHYFFSLLLAAVSLNSACSLWSGSAPATIDPPAPASQHTAVALPFSTKEPQTYQAEMIVSFPGDAAVTEQRYFTARDGERRRTDRELPGKETLSVLELTGGKQLILQQQKKCSPAEDAALPTRQGEAFTDFMTNEWLSERIPASYQEQGAEDVNGKSLKKYSVKFEKGGSQATVWIDEALGIPVKTEIYDLKDGQISNKVTTEFRNLKLSIDSNVFEKPPGCQNITAKEMKKLLWQERLNAE
jgi:hypothetical protein